MARSREAQQTKSESFYDNALASRAFRAEREGSGSNVRKRDRKKANTREDEPNAQHATDDGKSWNPTLQPFKINLPQDPKHDVG